jgi:hypothetical protein
VRSTEDGCGEVVKSTSLSDLSPCRCSTILRRNGSVVLGLRVIDKVTGPLFLIACDRWRVMACLRLVGRCDVRTCSQAKRHLGVRD